jgi:hypothetical protein
LDALHKCILPPFVRLKAIPEYHKYHFDFQMMSFVADVLVYLDRFMPAGICLTCCAPGKLCSPTSAVYLPIALFVILSAWSYFKSEEKKLIKKNIDHISVFDQVL